MTDQNCAYCMEGDLVAQFGIKICELPSSKVYLFKEQSHKGRVIVAHKKHVSEIVELTRHSILRRSTMVPTVTPDIIFTSILYQNTQMAMNGVAFLP